MKVTRPNAGRLAIAVAGTAILLAGCSGYDDDDDLYYTYGEPYYYTSDYYYMGSVYDPYYYYFKVGATATTQPGEEVIEPLTFHTDCSCFTRQSKYTGDEGFHRNRMDTVTFIDSAGAPITVDMLTAKAARIHHIRHVVSTDDSRQADITFNVTGDILRGAVPIKSVWNGSVSGSFNGQAIQSGVVDSVVRPFLDSAFSYPESGNISIDGELTDLLIEFQPDSTAQITVDNNRDGTAYKLIVDKDFKESDPVAE